MLCVVIPEVEDGDFSHFEGFGVQNQNPTVFERVECVAKFIRAIVYHRPIRKGQSAGRFVAGTYEFCYAFHSLEYCGILIFFED